MHFTVIMAFMILALSTGTFADNHNSEALFELDGDEYYTAVNAIVYENVGTHGTYDQMLR
jgi:hypothetical protein